MEMEFMAEFTEGMSRDRARKVIKRKRNHHRPCSPLHVSSGSTYSAGDCFIDSSSIADSPVMSLDTTTKEDEDMAYCLIMLAQGVSPVMTEDTSDQIHKKTARLSSRNLTETHGYECKTCNRTFPSFQALGGHRASHKKPKVNLEEKTSQMMNYVEQQQVVVNHKQVVEDEENKADIIITDNVQIINHNTKPKVHECLICGSEFLSGQALGGHMRKHRPVQPSGNRTGISTTATDDSISDQIVETSPHGNNSLLSLDLNFPPPEVVEDHRSTLPFTSGSSQKHMVLSSPAFVDCHY